MQATCSNCNKISEDPGEFWVVKNHYKMNGVWCKDCYELIAHDGEGNPNHPQEYLMILLKQEKIDG